MSETPPSNREADPAPHGGYSAAADLPGLRDMDRNLRAARMFRGLGADFRKQLDDIGRGRAELGDAVDGFYELMADTGWILLDRFNVEAINERVAVNDAGGLESDLIAWFSDAANLNVIVKRATVLPELSGRGPLLELALDDSLAGRHYSAVLVLLAVTDGLISDMERGSRRGLHARDPDKMVAWGSPVGHRQGLPMALKIYQRHIGKVINEEVLHLYRHGIVHGMVPHFNNPVVGSKAWTLLAALLEWARAEEAASKAAPTAPTLEQVLRNVERGSQIKSTLATWTGRSWHRSSAQESPPPEPVLAAAAELFDAWQRGRWALVASRIDPLGPIGSTKKYAGEVRARFGDVEIEAWSLVGFDFVGPMSADVDCEVVVAGETVESRTKWFYKDHAGKHLNEFEVGGTWRCIHDFPDEILRQPPSHS